MRITPTHALLIAVTLLATVPDLVQAQERAPADGIRSDRPGIGDGAWVLAPDVIQTELGLTINDVGLDRIGVGSALVRWGLDFFELRFYLPSPLFSVEPDGTEFGDLGVGAKIPLSFGDAWTWSVVGGATFPTGSDGGTADATTGFGTLVGETSLTETVAFALNAGLSRAFEDGAGTTLSIIATPSFPLNETIGAYAGYAGFYTSGGGGDQHWLEAGIAGLLDSDTQWDLNSAYDLENETWFLGLGIARRWF